jgi:DedD protein
MAELVVTQDELALRRRARRRLVGAVAIALTVVVILPMLFDSEPKPLGPEVDIQIPVHDSPFETTPALAPSEKTAPGVSAEPPQAQPAEPTQAPAASKAEPVKAEVGKPPVPEKLKPEAMPDIKAKTEVKPASKGETKGETKADPKAESKPKLTPDSTFASKGYYLQLGAFGNESNARQLHTKATSAGFNAVMLAANGQYRVRVGPIPQHERALEIQARLKAKGFSPVMLGP